MADVTDMRGYVKMLEEMGELRRFEGVDLNLEVGAWGDSWSNLVEQLRGRCCLRRIALKSAQIRNLFQLGNNVPKVVTLIGRVEDWRGISQVKPICRRLFCLTVPH